MFHPCDLLPEELWRHHIFDKLPPEALISLSDAHPSWTQMLERRRSTILMQLCLPIIAGLTSQTERDDYGQRSSLNLLPHEDLLNIRLVCKACNQVVEHYFQKHADDNRPFINEKDPQAADFFNAFNDWEEYRRGVEERPEVLIVETGNAHLRRHKKTPAEISTWLDSLETAKFPSANPILSQEAIFYIENNTLEQEAVSVITRCLRAHGSHLRRCTFMIWIEGPNALERKYSLLMEWLQLVPNLTILEVDFGQAVYGPEGMVELENLIQNNPLPDLPQLSKLKIEWLPPPLEMALLRKYNKMETLELAMASCPEGSFAPVYLEHLINFAVNAPNAAQLNDLQQLITESWKVHLEKVEMYACALADLEHTPDYEWSDTFAFLNGNFSKAENLVKLQLDLPYYVNTSTREKRMKILMDTHTCRLRLPQLEQLKLMAGHSFQMDFLLPMRDSLKKLSIYNYHGFDDYPTNTCVECRQNIQWNGWLGAGLLKSNIWEAFPNLDFLRVQNDNGWTYRRCHGTPMLVFPGGGLEGPDGPVDDWHKLANGSGDGELA